MSPLTEKQLNHIRKLDADAPSATLSPGPSVSSTHARAAVKRCCAAWQRAFDAHRKPPPEGRGDSEYSASIQAGKAYCNAMPLLVDYEGICAFMACLSHGILIGAIPKEKSGQLAYTAQVALTTVQRAPKPLNSASGKASKSDKK